MRDIDAIMDALNLQLVRRYLDQIHWDEESRAAHRADDAEPGYKLENVAAHSWSVADAALMVASHFSNLDLERVLALAILHDKLEMITGDYDPVGKDGRGQTSHAFQSDARERKDLAEINAMKQYLSHLSPAAAALQADYLEDVIYQRTKEARFVKAIDKMQALAFVVAKKDGKMSNEHLAFSLRYSAKAVKAFPPIIKHYEILVFRLIERVASVRGLDHRAVETHIVGQFSDYLCQK